MFLLLARLKATIPSLAIKSSERGSIPYQRSGIKGSGVKGQRSRAGHKQVGVRKRSKIVWNASVGGGETRLCCEEI